MFLFKFAVLLIIYNKSSVNAVEKSQVITHGNEKHILLWPHSKFFPFPNLGSKNNAFIKYHCRYQNCFVTNDSLSLPSVTDFDLILFNVRDFKKLKSWPTQRSENQTYGFVALESPQYFPACDIIYEDFFNWTITYKINSDFRWGYIAIHDKNGTEIGPNYDIQWSNTFENINDNVKHILDRKSRTVAWFTSNCRPKSKRGDVAIEIDTELKKFNRSVDIYGACGNFKCPRSEEKKCFKKLRDDYFFYFSFENSFAEDYVTEKLFTALDNYVVPVVFGGANYSRFLPPESYLDARAMSAQELATTMDRVITNRTLYYNFFRWKNHYTYKLMPSIKSVCKLCEKLNTDSSRHSHPDFRRWWNGDDWAQYCR